MPAAQLVQFPDIVAGSPGLSGDGCTPEIRHRIFDAHYVFPFTYISLPGIKGINVISGM